MTDSSIEWTDVLSVQARICKVQPLAQNHSECSIRGGHPRIQVFVSLGAVARQTCRHNVAGSCLPAARDGDDMIPGGRNLLAVRTRASEFVKYALLSVCWDWSDSALPSVGA